jgi:hypothetical protein
MVLLLHMTAELPACINRTAMIASTQKNIFGFITMGVLVIFAGHKYAIPRSLQSVGTLVMDYKKLIFLELTDMMLKKAPRLIGRIRLNQVAGITVEMMMYWSKYCHRVKLV